MATRYFRIVTGQPMESVIISPSGPSLTGNDIVVASCDTANITSREEMVRSLTKLLAFIEQTDWPPA